LFFLSPPLLHFATTVSSEVIHGDRQRKEMALLPDPSSARKLALG
jgi:hypothetical protein